MVWTQPMTFTANTVLTAAQMNVHVRDNMLASEVAQITAAQDYVVADGYHQLARRRVASDRKTNTGTTKSTDYTDLTQASGTVATGTTVPSDVGPAVTVETGNAAWIILTTHMQSSLALSQAYMSFEISRPTGPVGPDGEPIVGEEAGEGAEGGEGAREPGDNWALSIDGLNAGGSFRRSYVDYISADLTPGLNTFTCKYRVGSESNTGSFTNRQIIVIPM